MRALLWVVGVVAGVLILLGLLLEAVRWLAIIGVIALVIVIVWGVVKGRQAMQHQSPPTADGRRRQNQSGAHVERGPVPALQQVELRAGPGQLDREEVAGGLAACRRGTRRRSRSAGSASTCSSHIHAITTCPTASR